jgi:hypothetical protein
LIKSASRKEKKGIHPRRMPFLYRYKPFMATNYFALFLPLLPLSSAGLTPTVLKIKIKQQASWELLISINFGS